LLETAILTSSIQLVLESPPDSDQFPSLKLSQSSDKHWDELEKLPMIQREYCWIGKNDSSTEESEDENIKIAAAMALEDLKKNEKNDATMFADLKDMEKDANEQSSSDTTRLHDRPFATHREHREEKSIEKSTRHSCFDNSQREQHLDTVTPGAQCHG